MYIVVFFRPLIQEMNDSGEEIQHIQETTESNHVNKDLLSLEEGTLLFL